MNYPNINTPRIAQKQSTNFTPMIGNISPTNNTPVNDLLKAGVYDSNTPSLGGQNTQFQLQSPTTVNQNQLNISSGQYNQQISIQGQQLLINQPQLSMDQKQEQFVHNNKVIQTKLFRPVLPSYHQQFYDQLSMQQKLEFFGGQTQLQQNIKKWDRIETSIKFEIKPQSTEQQNQPVIVQSNNPQLSLNPPSISQELHTTSQLTNDIKQILNKPSLTQQIDDNDMDSKAKRTNFYQEVRKSLFQSESSSLINQHFEELYSRYQISPQFQELVLNPTSIYDFSIQNEFGQVNFSQCVDITNIEPSQISITFGDFNLPAKLASKPFIIILYGIYVEDELNTQLFENQAKSRNLKFIHYNSKLKKLVMSNQ